MHICIKGEQLPSHHDVLLSRERQRQLNRDALVKAHEGGCRTCGLGLGDVQCGSVVVNSMGVQGAAAGGVGRALPEREDREHNERVALVSRGTQSIPEVLCASTAQPPEATQDRLWAVRARLHRKRTGSKHLVFLSLVPDELGEENRPEESDMYAEDHEAGPETVPWAKLETDSDVGVAPAGRAEPMHHEGLHVVLNFTDCNACFDIKGFNATHKLLDEGDLVLVKGRIDYSEHARPDCCSLIGSCVRLLRIP